MKRSGFKRKLTKPLKRTPIRVKGKEEVSTIKEDIQALLRQIVMLRDGGCILRDKGKQSCNGYAKDGHLILQADHLISRGNNATYGDSRLVVCLCKGHHGWKSVGSNLRKQEYDELVKTILPKERVALWERCEEERQRFSTGGKYDWKLIRLGLEKELEHYKELVSI